MTRTGRRVISYARGLKQCVVAIITQTPRLKVYTTQNVQPNLLVLVAKWPKKKTNRSRMPLVSIVATHLKALFQFTALFAFGPAESVSFPRRVSTTWPSLRALTDLTGVVLAIFGFLRWVTPPLALAADAGGQVLSHRNGVGVTSAGTGAHHAGAEDRSAEWSPATIHSTWSQTTKQEPGLSSRRTHGFYGDDFQQIWIDLAGFQY